MLIKAIGSDFFFGGVTRLPITTALHLAFSLSPARTVSQGSLSRIDLVLPRLSRVNTRPWLWLSFRLAIWNSYCTRAATRLRMANLIRLVLWQLESFLRGSQPRSLLQASMMQQWL